MIVQEEMLATMLGPRGDLSTALAEALHQARTNPGGHEVVTAIIVALDALRELRAALGSSQGAGSQ